jgi:hypothetical protein
MVCGSFVKKVDIKETEKRTGLASKFLEVSLYVWLFALEVKVYSTVFVEPHCGFFLRLATSGHDISTVLQRILLHRFPVLILSSD